MIESLWNWLTTADEHVTCSSALFSISFTLNILLSAIPSARKNFFRIVRCRVHDSVSKTVNADTLSNIDDNSRVLAYVGKLYKWLIAPFYDNKPVRVRWSEVIATLVMICLAVASVILIAVDNKSRLGLLFCLPFPIYFLLYSLFLFLRFGLIKLLAFIIRKCCAKKDAPKKAKASEVFADIATMTGVTTFSSGATATCTTPAQSPAAE